MVDKTVLALESGEIRPLVARVQDERMKDQQCFRVGGSGSCILCNALEIPLGFYHASIAWSAGRRDEAYCSNLKP